MAGISIRRKNDEKNAFLSVKVIPRSGKNEVVEILGDGTVKIKLASPPVEGKANQALLEFLSDILDVPVSRLEIVSGKSARKKLISVADLDPSIVMARIRDQI